MKTTQTSDLPWSAIFSAIVYYIFEKNIDIVIFEADKGGAVVNVDDNRICNELTFSCTDIIVRDVKKQKKKKKSSTRQYH